MRTALLWLAVLAGCDDVGMTPLAEDTAVTSSITVPACDVTIEQTVPEPDSTEAYHRAPIEFHLSGPDRSAKVVTSIPGTNQRLHDDWMVQFVPDAPLEPDTDYLVSLEYCTGTAPFTFRTSDLGSPLELPVEDLVGRTYSLGLSEARFLAGPSVAELVGGVFTDALLVGVVEAGSGGLALRVAMPADGEQDPCSRTLDLPALLSTPSEPFFDVVLESVEFDAYNGAINLAELAVSGTWAPDLSSFGGGTLDTTIDARDLADMMGVLDVPTLCDIAEGFGTPCTPCPDDEVASCVRVEVDSATATEVALPALVEVTELEPECSE